MTTQQFVDQWSEGPNSFLEDPPNAVLSYAGMGDDAGDHLGEVEVLRVGGRAR